MAQDVTLLLPWKGRRDLPTAGTCPLPACGTGVEGPQPEPETLPPQAGDHGRASSRASRIPVPLVFTEVHAALIIFEDRSNLLRKELAQEQAGGPWRELSAPPLPPSGCFRIWATTPAASLYDCGTGLPSGRRGAACPFQLHCGSVKDPSAEPSPRAGRG